MRLLDLNIYQALIPTWAIKIYKITSFHLNVKLSLAKKDPNGNKIAVQMCMSGLVLGP